MSYQAIPIEDSHETYLVEKGRTNSNPLYVVSEKEPRFLGIRKSTWKYGLILFLIGGLYMTYPTVTVEDSCSRRHSDRPKHDKHIPSHRESNVVSQFFDIAGKCTAERKVDYGGATGFSFDSSKVDSVTIRSKSQFISGNINVEIDASLIGIIIPRNATITPNIMVDDTVFDEHIVTVNEKFDDELGYVLELDTPSWSIINGKSNCVFMDVKVKLPKYHSTLKHITFVNVDGSVQLAPIQVLELISVHAETVNGDIEMSSLNTQHVKASNANGDINIAPSQRMEMNTAELTNVNGNIALNDLQTRDLTITNMSGKISVTNTAVEGNSKISTTNGKLNAQMDLGARTVMASFETVKGNINLEIKDNFVGKFDTHNLIGSITIEGDKDNVKFDKNKQHSKTGFVGESNDEEFGRIEVASADGDLTLKFVPSE